MPLHDMTDITRHATPCHDTTDMYNTTYHDMARQGRVVNLHLRAFFSPLQTGSSNVTA